MESVHQDRINALKSSRQVKDVHIVKTNQFSPEKFLGEVTMEFPKSSTPYVVEEHYIDWKSPTEYFWKGTNENAAHIISREKGLIYGHFQTEDKIYDLEPISKDFGFLIEYDREGMNEIAFCSSENGEHVSDIKSMDLNRGSQSANAEVRMLVLFTDDAQNSGFNVNTIAQLARNQWVGVNVNSWAVTDLEVAAVVRLNGFQEIDNMNTNVTNLANNITAQNLRNQHEAEIVMLLVDRANPSSRGIVFEIGPEESTAYAAVDVDFATSSYSLIHEAAHLLGARHQVDAENNHVAAHGDSHGHEWRKSGNDYGSIMAIGLISRQAHWSNPTVTNRTRATGSHGVSYVTRRLNINGHVVEDFRFTPLSVDTNITGPLSADTGDPVTFTSFTSGGTGPYSYNWRLNLGGGYYTASTTSSVSINMPSVNMDVKLIVTDASGDQTSDYQQVINITANGCTICEDPIQDGDLDNSDPIFNQENTESAIGSIQVYPNPTDAMLHLDLSTINSDSPLLLSFIDIHGRVLGNREITTTELNSNKTISIDVSDFESGIYFLRYNHKSLLATKRIVIN